MKAYKLLYSAIYMVIVAFYPLVEIFSGHGNNSFLQVLSIVAGYILPFFLYLFLSVLIYDIFLLLNFRNWIIPLETRKSFSFRLYMPTAMILFSIAIVLAGAVNLNTIRVSEYQVKVPKRNSRLTHLRVAFVADIHIQKNISLNYIKKYAVKMDALKPDIILYGGDMVEGDSENETSEAIESVFRSIHTKYGTFGVPGNHEFYGGQEQGSFFRNAGIKMLCDTMVMIDSSFYIAGRYDQHYRKRKAVTEILGNTSAYLPVILMDHRPTELQQVISTATDVQFSGHTHNGQLFPLNFIISKMYELSRGYRKIKNTHFFVTSGLRLWGPPVKTAGKSEIMMVDIRFE
jgi:uncharacterized protein